jgi:flagellar motor protein MotB
MAGSWKNRSEPEGVNAWPAFADMAAATCMMLAIIWIAGARESSGRKNEVARLNSEIAKLKSLVNKDAELVTRIRVIEGELLSVKSQNNLLIRERDEAEQNHKNAVTDLEKLRKERPNVEPPNIVLKQDESFFFDSLQAVLPKGFETQFAEKKRNEVIAALNSQSNIEVIEIIGHTDNKEVGGTSNVDTNLGSVYAGTRPIRILEFGSNCELGLARAIAVKTMLQEFLRSLKVGDGGLTKKGKDRISNLTYRTYSAAQLFPTNPMNPGRDEDRRIEIRFTRLRRTSDDLTSPESPSQRAALPPVRNDEEVE